MPHIELYLPAMACIPHAVQINKNLSDSAKLFWGQIAAIARGGGYLWCTNDQLAQLRGVSVRSIERWLQELESEGYIRRETMTKTIKNSGGLDFSKSRKIYICDPSSKKELPARDEGVGVGAKDPNENLFSQPITAKIGGIETAKNGGRITAKNGGRITAKNGGCKDIRNIKKNDRTEAVVVLSLSKLNLSDSLRLKLKQQYTPEQLDLAVERCLRWGGRPSDEVGILSALRDSDSWQDHQPKDQALEANTAALRKMAELDGKTVAGSIIYVGADYIEFAAASQSTIFGVADPKFLDLVGEHMRKLRDYADQEEKRKKFFEKKQEEEWSKKQKIL